MRLKDFRPILVPESLRASLRDASLSAYDGRLAAGCTSWGLDRWLIAVLMCAAVSSARAQTEDAAMVHARQFLASRPIIDGHNDLAWEIRTNPVSRMDVAKYPLRTPAPGQTDFDRMRTGGIGGQFWSVYIPGDDTAKQYGYAKMQLEQIDIARRVIARYPDQLRLALSARDIVEARKAGRVASLLGMEGGHAIENSLALLRMYYALGVRYMTLTHNVTLDWADAALDETKPSVGGLTLFGRDVVREMNRLGMIVDLSHVAPSTMSAALDASVAPVMFSHSSARGLMNNARDVPDSILARMPANGGVVMVTFVSGFLRDISSGPWRQMLRDSLGSSPDSTTRAQFILRHPRPNATAADVANHIEYIRKLAGVDHVGLGGDYDGTTELPDGMRDVSGYPLVFAELIRRGWSDNDLRKLAGENILRVLRDVEATRDRLAKSP
jgi:membrane dipeptidase